MGLLDGKVAVITGAGGGIGRSHALLFAREGAKVVVNDLGGSRDGTGESQSLADQVVGEIREAGGEAVANYDSVATVEGASGIIQSAVDAFGGVDILVNNAGILRDKTLLKMEEPMWDLVIDVHLKGSFAVGQAAARVMVEQGRGGRIINTTSIAGLKGNYGQSNYAAAKAGIYGMTMVWSMELAKHGITANAVAPMAKTRMTDDIAVIGDEMKPEFISRPVLFLASELASEVNGRIFGVHGEHVFEYRMEMSEGARKAPGEMWTPQELADQLDAIGRFEAEAPATAAAAAPVTSAEIIAAAFDRLPEVFVPAGAAGWTANVQFEIAGADDYTLKIGDGACEVVKGKVGEPTCTVKVKADVYADVVMGKTKPEKAFMEGKITATNLGDMMKFGQAFDMKKAREIAEREKAAAAPGAGGGAAAAAAPPTSAEIIAAAFDRLPEVFVPAGAAGWTANVQFEIAGADDYTLKIGDGACEVVKGKAGEPTCTVKVKADVYADVVMGKTKPEKAFMEGKITATNLGDMMKFGQAFDMKKAREIADREKAAAAPAAGGGAVAPAPKPAGTPAGPAEIIAAAFDRLPEVFVPAGAAGWTANVQFEIAGADDYTLKIADGACEVIKGQAGEPTCTVKVKAADYADVVSGKMRPEKAFMEGKISASNLGDMMRFGQAFDMKKAREIAEKAKAAAGAGSASEPAESSGDAGASAGGLNRDYLGRRVSGEPVWLSGEGARAYALATNDENPAYLDDSRPGGVVAPPLFPVRLFKDLLFTAMTDDDLGADLLRLVHGEQDMRFHRPLSPGDLCTLRAWVDDIEDKSSGQILSIGQKLFVDGQEAVDSMTRLFIRSKSKKKGGKGKVDEAKESDSLGEPTFKEAMEVTGDQPLRYAHASGDNNPIHVDETVAKLAGFPSVILQGLCTMAFTSQAVIRNVADGDPDRLRRLKVRFAKPVLPSDALITEGWVEESNGGSTLVSFRTRNQDGVDVIVNGEAEVAPV